MKRLRHLALVGAVPSVLSSCANLPTDHSLTNGNGGIWQQCGTDAHGLNRYLSYGILQTRVYDAWKYCQRVATFNGFAAESMSLVSIGDESVDTCVNQLLTSVSTQQGTKYTPTASIGALYNENTNQWTWADGYESMASASDFNKCINIDPVSGICAHQADQKCLIATIDSTDGYYWDSYSCDDAHVNFMCQFSCDPTGTTPDPGTWPPPGCWWCSPGPPPRPGKMQQMVGFVGNTTDDDGNGNTNIYVQEQDLTLHKIPLPKKTDGTSAQFPYIAYNDAVQQFEVVGSFNSYLIQKNPNGDGDGSYHYFVDFLGNSQKVSNSNYDGRSGASFVYVPDVRGTILVGGFPPSPDNDAQYESVMSNPMIYASSSSTNNYILPKSWAPGYKCQNGAAGTCKTLAFPQTSYHAGQLFVVGGSSYANCPAPGGGGAEGIIWSLKFDQKNTELQWTEYTSLDAPAGSCRGVMTFTDTENFLLTTTLNKFNNQISYDGFEAFKFGANNSYVVSNAFKNDNDMPVQFKTVANQASSQTSWSVMGGRFRNKDNLIETIYSFDKESEFQVSGNQKFPDGLVGVQLLGTTLSNTYEAPIYDP